jgi:hypothetical protein
MFLSHPYLLPKQSPLFPSLSFLQRGPVRGAPSNSTKRRLGSFAPRDGIFDAVLLSRYVPKDISELCFLSTHLLQRLDLGGGSSSVNG